MTKPTSITVTRPAPNLFEIRGCTYPHIALFKQLGAEWQGRALCWMWKGEKLPTPLQQLADGIYGLESLKTGVLAIEAPTTPKTLETPIAPKRQQKTAAKKATPKPEKSKPSKTGFTPTARVTPLRAQYLEIKAQYQDCILLFELGDFYETFDDDARLTADDCDLVLTGRPVSRTERVDMAGFPVHALTKYVELLLKANRKVAVCDQIGEPDGTGIVERKVTRVFTPDGGLE
jgi:hypothetical protein